MQYRTLNEEDAVFLTRVFSTQEYDLYFAENATTEDEWKERRSLFETEQSYIISKDSRDIGWIMYDVCGEICELDIVVLLPEERFKGYGKEIFADLFAMNPQLKTIKLDVQQRNKHAISFYKKIGFQIIGEDIQPVNGKDVPYFKMALNR